MKSNSSIFAAEFVSKVIKMTLNERIKEKLQHGDYITIAEKTGYSRQTVSQQMTGRRKLKDKILSAAIEIIRNREQLINSAESI